MVSDREFGNRIVDMPMDMLLGNPHRHGILANWNRYTDFPAQFVADRFHSVD